MKGRVKFKDGTISQAFNWIELVEKPFHDGRVIEAFASADAILDAQAEALLRHIYSDHKSQDLINEMHLIRSRVNFDGLTLFEILNSKTVISTELIDKIRQFKKARNLVLHNTEGEYSLVIGNAAVKYSDQEELDSLVTKESKKWLIIGFEIFVELYEVTGRIDPEYYFSVEFYHANPRGKMAQKLSPKTSRR